MRQGNLKKIIKEELKDILEPNNALYVFDFDDTLVSVTSTIYVISADKKTRTPLSVSEFQSHKLQPGETADFTEFEEVAGPTPNSKMMALLRKHLGKSVILTARSEAQPVSDYLEAEQGLQVPQVVAVGIKDDTATPQESAQRKKAWIAQEIRRRNYKYVEFWDDNKFNIDAVWSLQTEYPGVKIVCHLVRS